jgi:hypothetical protein
MYALPEAAFAVAPELEGELCYDDIGSEHSVTNERFARWRYRGRRNQVVNYMSHTNGLCVEAEEDEAKID